MHTSATEADFASSSPARQRRMTTYQTREARPRWVLHIQAVFWRVLMKLGMFFHKLALPRPPKPDFYREIPATISGREGKIGLYFYVPKDYQTQRRLWVDREEDDEGYADVEDDRLRVGASRESSDDSLGKIGSAGSRQSQGRRASIASTVGRSIRRLSSSGRRWGGYPVVINFHGGGFTLGSADDDARWCGTVVDECHAVVVSVDYRRAPEFPFPTAVEDGVDAVFYIHDHADELGIDKDKIALSGFSSGGNMAFTVPLRLYDQLTSFSRDDVSPLPTSSHLATVEEASRPGSSTADASSDTAYPMDTVGPNASSSSPHQATTTATGSSPSKTATTSTITEQQPTRDVKIRMLIPWYPPVDYTRTREERRATGCRPDQELPAIFTDLFDESYLHPPHTISLDSPYLSPGVAPTSLLRNALPNEIIMHTCEWDMLLSEGRAFAERLESDDVGKRVWYKMIEGVPHGWDKAPNPWKPTPGVREHYLRACKEMRRVFYADLSRSQGAGDGKGSGRAGEGSRRVSGVAGTRPPVERLSTVGRFPTAAPRGSVQVVR